jgi:hypothetical protein
LFAVPSLDIVDGCAQGLGVDLSLIGDGFKPVQEASSLLYFLTVLSLDRLDSDPTSALEMGCHLFPSMDTPMQEIELVDHRLIITLLALEVCLYRE